LFSRGLQDCQLLIAEGEVWPRPEPAVVFEVFCPGDWVCLRVCERAEQPKAIWLLAPNLLPDFPVAKTTGLAISFTEFVNQTRRFFTEKGYTEASTPTLVKCPGLEPQLEPFATEWSNGPEDHHFYLPTSPEIHLKKLLCRGWRRVFEIAKVFRNDVKSRAHRPEFHMLEWYMAFADLCDLQEVLEDYLLSLGWQQQVWQQVTVSELFLQALQFELTPETSKQQLRELCKKQNLDFSAGESFDDLYQRLWVHHIEPKLEAQQGATLVRDFPPSQAALARLNAQGWADRFELYLNGREVANAYQELNDGKEQRRRFVEFQRQRRDDVPVDEEFLRHLDAGMPPAAGIAVGLERVYMALLGIESIDSVFEFGFENDSEY
jgi:lysyl-tRNA synthetase class 2